MSDSQPPYPANFRQRMIELVRAGRNPGELIRFAIRVRGVTVAARLHVARLWHVLPAPRRYDVFPEFASPQVSVQAEAA